MTCESRLIFQDALIGTISVLFYLYNRLIRCLKYNMHTHTTRNTGSSKYAHGVFRSGHQPVPCYRICTYHTSCGCRYVSYHIQQQTGYSRAAAVDNAATVCSRAPKIIQTKYVKPMMITPSVMAVEILASTRCASQSSHWQCHPIYGQCGHWRHPLLKLFTLH